MDYDLIVLGAGLYGIQAARTYLDIHPKARVLLFEAGKTIGGAWSAERNYKHFWTQVPVGMCEFSDQPLAKIDDSNRFYDLFPANFVTSYLEDYVDSHAYDSQSLRSRIRTSTSVSTVEKFDGKWTVTTDEQKRYVASKLVDATGLTSMPIIPQISGISQFRGLGLHSRDFGQSKVLKDDTVQNIVVIGGAKSAADIAYSAAKAGKSTSWIIRKSGAGPAALVNPKGVSHTNSNEDLYTRFISTFILSVFSPENLWTRFLSHTHLGRVLLTNFWKSVDRQIISFANFDRADAKDHGYANLKPDTGIFWQNDSTGVNNRPDYFDTIANLVTIHRADISHATASDLHLANGIIVPADAIVYATGYSNSSPHYSPSLRAKLGLPIPKTAEDPKDMAHWGELERKADKEICAQFPILEHPPPHYKQEVTQTPFRLYRAMLPVTDQDIVFVGKIGSGNHFRIAEAQALWAVAALDRSLSQDGPAILPPKEGLEKAIAKTVAWCRRRYLAKGEAGNWFYWDVVPYTDRLLADLGLKSHRRVSWWKDYFTPCYAADFKGLVEEYKLKFLK